MFGSLFGFGIGIIFAVFHIWGMVFVFSVNVSSLVRYSIDSGPRFLRCWMHMLSGPVDVLFLACFIAMRVCVFVIMIFYVPKWRRVFGVGIPLEPPINGYSANVSNQPAPEREPIPLCFLGVLATLPRRVAGVTTTLGGGH